MPRYVDIETASEGLILAEPVLNNFGQTLLPAGTVLADKHKKILKTWNIRSVYVKDSENEEDFNLSPELREKALEHISKRMLWEPANKFEENLLQMGIINTARNTLNKPGGAK